MRNSIKNTFGIAAAILMLLGVNVVTEDANIRLPDYKLDSEVTRAENRSLNTLKDFNDAIVDIAEKTNPAVVTIKTEKTTQVNQRIPDVFQRFFDMPENGGTREYTRRGLGSGVVVSDDGYIITNNHVVEGTDEITVGLYNGDEVSARIIGRDPQTDIAVIKVEDTGDLQSIKIGNSDNASVGSFVLAIGSPLDENLAHTVSYGIVSARGRNIGIIRDESGNPYGYEDFIQTDAAINPGNSGGALIDMNGELVGINSAIASRSGGNDGIGFAIPINLAKRIMDDLIDDGVVSRGYLGLGWAGNVDRTMAQALGLKDTRGFLVGEIVDGEAADRAGIEENDIVVGLDGEPVKSFISFRSSIAGKRPGDRIILTVIRDGKEKDITVTLGALEDGATAENPAVENEDMEELLGFNVTELTEDIKNQLELSPNTNGVVVNRISESSNAAERGLIRGAVISEVKGSKDRNATKINSVEDFYNAIDKIRNNDDDLILLTTIFGNRKQFVAFEL
ncbi:Do family serine endopeptidase [Balneola sp. MJW-20]|uniref:Do family serine endopeptidase n=1 Tax=Gracilimonas aurantiaca TaxID=3234185 RepID=UPI003465A446